MNMPERFHGVLREASAAVSWRRREFLRAAAGAFLGPALLRSGVQAADELQHRKAVVVTFGGGARDDELQKGGSDPVVVVKDFSPSFSTCISRTAPAVPAIAR